MSERSYQPANEGRGIDQEMARLEAQVAVSWEEERRLLERLGLQTRMRVLEIGCGPGLVTKRLIDAWPGMRVAAVDHDAGLLARARQLLAGSAVEFIEAPAETLPFGDNEFDFAIARYVFQHLPQPVEAAREARRVLRPGGRLVAIDVDAALWGVAEPSFPEVIPIMVKTGRAQAVRGGDRLIGRKLHRILADAGFADARLDTFAYHSDAIGLDAFDPQLSADRLFPLIARGIITNDEFEVVQRAHAKFRASPGAFILMFGFAGTGTK
jgi:ubiquinone/menaquinone biosynthesis C-methylase UbiE